MEAFKALAHLRAGREVPVGEIQAELEIPGPTLSHHPEPQGRALRLLLGAVGAGVGPDPAADRVLLEGSGTMGSMTDVQIAAAVPGDLPAVLGLLDGAGLPRAGVTTNFGQFLVARAGQETMGAVGLERYGASALLRSLVVAPARRGQGLGAALVGRALDVARTDGIERVFLLTITAVEFFRRLGFREVPREDIDLPVQASGEFVATCCQSAVAMRLDLSEARVALASSSAAPR
ncbi:MAG TPA: arsenic resistance N-acetyltransferase ArsN2 [Methylomirabilota bacterium]